MSKMKEPSYLPPFTVTTKAINLVAEISALIGRYVIRLEKSDGLRLRKVNRIKTIHSSLAIEGNKLSEDQVRDIIDGKSVIAPLREIQEVKNAMNTYELYSKLNPFSEKDLLKAHAVMMNSLTDDAGRFRHGGVGVFAGEKCVHLAPPATRVPFLIGDLFVETNKSKSFILGYTLDSDYWNQGIASEIVSAFLEYMKNELLYGKAICYAYKDNVRSIHLLKKLGFKKFSESFFYGDEGYVKLL